MFNILISADETAWETDHRMSMSLSRFGEFSGDERQSIDIHNTAHLKRLEMAQSLLMYEECVTDPHTDHVKLGQMRDIRVANGTISFRFTETGRIPREKIVESAHRLQISEWELNRTHWAIKDGHIPQDVLRHLTLTPKAYDIVLSFAGEDRPYVSEVADFLRDHGVEVFYDDFEQAGLW